MKIEYISTRLTANEAPTGFLIHLGGFCKGKTFSCSWGTCTGAEPNGAFPNDSATFEKKRWLNYLIYDVFYTLV